MCRLALRYLDALLVREYNHYMYHLGWSLTKEDAIFRLLGDAYTHIQTETDGYIYTSTILAILFELQ